MEKETIKKIDVPELRREIFVLNSYINRFDGKVLTQMNLSVPQAKVIFLLYSSTRKEVYPKDVDACLGMTHSTTSGILSRMQAKGLITQYPSEVDKRRKALVLTEKGTQAYLDFIQKFEMSLNKLIENIPPEELEITCKALRAMIKNMK